MSSQAHRDAQRRYKWKKRGGWTEENREATLKEQGGGCAICGKPEGRRRMDGDHSSRTGKRRGLLCNEHNLMIGFAKDDPEILEKAAAYLRKHA